MTICLFWYIQYTEKKQNMDMENWYNQNIFGATTQLSVIPNLCITAVYLGLQEYFRTVAEKGLEKKN